MSEKEDKGGKPEEELVESITKLVMSKISARGLDEETKKMIEKKIKEALEKKKKEAAIQVKLPSQGKGGASEEGMDDILKEYWDVKAPLMAISEFLKDLKEPITELIKAITGGLSGDQIGKDVAQFYKHLIEAGIDKELAREMTLEYFRKRTSMADLGSMLMKMFSKGKGFAIAGKSRSEEKELEEEEEEKEEGES